MRRSLVLLVLLVLPVLFAGCGSNGSAPPTGQSTWDTAIWNAGTWK